MNELRDAENNCYCPTYNGFDVCQGGCLTECGVNETRDTTDCECKCSQGFEDIGGKCLKKCKENELRDSYDTCYCPS